MVDAVDLPLLEDALERLVQRPGGLEIVAERLLDDDPGPAVLRLREPLLPEEADDLRVGFGRRREVEDPVVLSSALRLNLLEDGSE